MMHGHSKTNKRLSKLKTRQSLSVSISQVVRFTWHRSMLQSGLHSIQGLEICSSRSAAAGKDEEEEEKRPDLYMLVYCTSSSSGYEWFVIKDRDVAMSPHKSQICECGALDDLTDHPIFPTRPLRPEVSTVALGPLVYTFGGFDRENKCSDSPEVSYIDTRCLKDGWKVCGRDMPKGRARPYLVTLNDKNIVRVLLISTGLLARNEPPFVQIYYPSENRWIVKEKESDPVPYLFVAGHAVVQEGDQTIVLMHEFSSPKLYTYNVDTGLWGSRWDGEFGLHYQTGALVDGIYYVLSRYSLAGVFLYGYDLSLKKAACVPVTISTEKKEEVEAEWLPLPYSSGMLPSAKLFLVGDGKMGMVWLTHCFYKGTRKMCAHWSTFEMRKESTHDGGWKLYALPLSHVCYHVINGFGRIDNIVLV